MSEQRQKEELERILKEVYNEYQGIYYHRLYYKMSHRDAYDALLLGPLQYFRIVEVALEPSLEYAVYVQFSHTIRPSEICIKSGNYSGVLLQLVGSISMSPLRRDEPIRYVVFSEEDPLGQVLRYRQLIAGYGPQHTYLCLSVVIIEPYSPDPASIFPGKKGIVARCITLADFLHVGSSGIDEASMKLSDIYSYALDKLHNDEELKNIRKRDPVSACNISLLAGLIQNEIEEANEIMRKYNIIHVAFPLD